MSRCQICGKIEVPPFRCKYCDGVFCGDHRLPPKHNCPSIRLWESKPSPKRAPKMTDKKRKYLRSTPPPPSKPASRIKRKRKSSKFALLLIFLFIIVASYIYYSDRSGELKNLPFSNVTNLSAPISSQQIGNLTSNIFREPEPINDDTYKIEQLVFERVNQVRRLNGLHELKWDPLLANVARNHSLDMAINNFFSHINPKGEDPTKRAAKAGISTKRRVGNVIYIGVGENIGKVPKGNVEGYGYVGSPEDVAEAAVQMWMNSPGHRANILDKNYIFIGVGVVYDPEEDAYYLTQDFM